MEDRIPFQEVWQEKEVAIVGELEKEAAGLVGVFFRKSTFQHVFRQTDYLEGITGEREIKCGVGFLTET